MWLGSVMYSLETVLCETNMNKRIVVNFGLRECKEELLVNVFGSIIESSFNSWDTLKFLCSFEILTHFAEVLYKTVLCETNRNKENDVDLG